MSERFAVETSSYKGPLEALLELIESRELAISDISLAEVTDAYIAYVEKLPEMPLGETAQFVLVASTLLLIKSRSLLPTLSISDEERESVEELERRLAHFALVRNAARLLRKEWGRAPLLFAKRAPHREAIFSPAESSAKKIYEAVRELIAHFPKLENLAQAVVAPILKLEEVIVHLRDRLSQTLRTRWSELIKGRDKHEAIVHFLAVLELVRSGNASATQQKLFSDILIEAESLAAPKY